MILEKKWKMILQNKKVFLEAMQENFCETHLR